jgi:signal transduction histidine kinase
MASITLEWTNRAAGLADRNWQVEDQARVMILADGQRLTQAVLNLATNAARHTAVGDAIHIGSSVVGDTVRIWVRDTGPGIALEDQERIFQRFAQGASRQGRGEGVGLGLAIVRAIVEAHGGTVEVASVPGEGALFTLVIPYTDITPSHDPGSQDPWRAS